MSKVIHLKKGLDISLQGAAEKVLVSAEPSQFYAVKPTDFEGITPKLLVKVDDVVKAGTPIFFDKYRPEILFTSPVSGKVKDIVRGEKRKILEIVIEAGKSKEYEQFEVQSISALTKESLTELLLKSGLWTTIIQRPFGVIADPTSNPKGIFVSMFDTAPLAPDIDFVLQNREEEFSMGIEALKILSSNKVTLSMHDTSKTKEIAKIKGIETPTFTGQHPAGNVGVQIHHLNPISKGEVAWTIDPQAVIMIGSLLKNGKVDMTKIIAVAGSEVQRPCYMRIISGATISSILDKKIKPQADGDNIRIISGNVLTGIKVEGTGYISFYSNMITIIPEGDKYQFLGWIAPRLNRFSVSRSYFSWLTPSKKYRLDTNLNGGHRAYVMTGEYEKVLPMDIYPVYLIKAILAGDIDKMENLGIYEVVEEDLALCEFICTSKTEVQSILRSGINQMIKELS